MLPSYKLISSTNGICINIIGHCFAVCTTIFPKEEIVLVNSRSLLGNTSVSCPENYLVPSCALDQSVAEDLDPNPSSYMLNSATCQCFSSHLHICQAVCVQNRYNLLNTYKIISNTSVGTIKTSCPLYSYVLGCGYEPLTSNSSSRWYVRPDQTHCECYNDQGATCYTTCAEINMLIKKTCN